MKIRAFHPFLFLFFLGLGASASVLTGTAYGQEAAALEELQITEVMYQPLDVDAVDGDSLEYIELKNTGAASLDLGGVVFSDGIDFVFAAGTTIGAGEYVVLAANALEFENFYGFAPDGDYQGRLANGGEQLTLRDAGGAELISFAYRDRFPWPEAANGAGFALVLISEAAGLDLNDPTNWRGGQFGGTPGAAEPATLTVPSIRVNELLTHTDPPFKDAVELFNPTNVMADLGGWYLTDEKTNPRKYRMPAGTSIAPQGYLVFDEDDFNPTPGVDPGFALSSFGDALYLFSADAQDNLSGYVHGFTFGAAENGVTFGRETWETGEEEMLPQLSETLGRENSGARIGPVVISELMYGPATGQDEFIELVNISSQTISLYDQQFPENRWRFDGVDFTFPENAALEPGGIALVVPLPPEVFRASYGIPASVQIFGPYSGRLNNAGESIQLQSPGDPDLDGTVPYVIVDEVMYGDSDPWPTEADGNGASLYKTNLDGLSNDPANWRPLANGGTPGFANLGSVSIENSEAIFSSVKITPAYPNPFNSSARVHISTGHTKLVQISLVDVLGRRVQVLFDGLLQAGQIKEVVIARDNLPAGLYFIHSRGDSRQAQPLLIK